MATIRSASRKTAGTVSAVALAAIAGLMADLTIHPRYNVQLSERYNDHIMATDKLITGGMTALAIALIAVVIRAGFMKKTSGFLRFVIVALVIVGVVLASIGLSKFMTFHPTYT